MIFYFKKFSLITLLILVFLFLCLINFVIFQFDFVGVTQKKSQLNKIFFPKGYVIGIVWTILIMLQTIAFKKIKTIKNSAIIFILILNCILYPIYTLGFSNLQLIILGNLISLGISSFVAGFIYSDSFIYALLVLLTSVWIIYVTFLLFNVHT